MLDWLNRKLAVQPDHESTDPDFLLRLSRASQAMRSHQSHRVLPLVLLIGVTFCYALWDDAPRLNLVVWTVLTAISAIVRILVCRQIEKSIEQADEATLARNERLLLWSALCNTVIVGSGFWWVGLAGSERAIIAVTLLSCMYGIGTTVNSSVHYPPFPYILAGNMAQGVLFHSGLGTQTEPATLIIYMSIIFVLLVFGKENARVFGESIKIRVENLYLVRQLAQEKQEVESALRVAQEANESKNRFLAAASHDLRQPLHALSLFHGSLSMEIQSERGQQLMNRIDETTSVLRDQFNSLLDLSRFDAGGVDPEPKPFRIDELIHRVAETNRPLAEAKSLNFIVDAPIAQVCTDELLLERVLQNLISNAIRYTTSGSISLSASIVAATDADSGEQDVEIKVEDTGVGISTEDQKRIFEDFTQLQNPERRREQGVGLGLAIVRRIDQLLNLRLSLQSEADRGTCFTLRLPKLSGEIELSESHATRPRSRAGTGFESFEVWSVDDDRRVREALTMQLTAWGCTVESFDSAQTVQDYAETTDRLPDLLLLDDMMEGGARGLELAEHFGESMASERIVLVTGNTDRERMAQIRASRFQMLQKPVQSNALEHLIAQLCH